MYFAKSVLCGNPVMCLTIGMRTTLRGRFSGVSLLMALSIRVVDEVEFAQAANKFGYACTNQKNDEMPCILYFFDVC